MERIMSLFAKKVCGLNILAFLGHASEDGAWSFVNDGMIRLREIVDNWNRYQRLPDDNLLIYSDTCYSGRLCSDACEIMRDSNCCNVFVQASCGEDESALDHV